MNTCPKIFQNKKVLIVDDVISTGESLEADTNANKQKTMLVDILEKMSYSQICDLIIDNAAG